MTLTLTHTSHRDDLTSAHGGLCATESTRAQYGEHLYTVEIPDGLVVEELEADRARIDANDWPGDTAAERAAFAARGVDVILYEDMDESGRPHWTWRLVSERAVALTTITISEE